MSLLTYDDVRPQAKDIRDEVSEGHMPPWHAEAPNGTFLNERGLTDGREEHAVRLGRTTGAPKGDPKDMPPAPIYPDGWAMGKPDVVFEMQEEYKVPAEGVIEYQYFYIPTNFTEPKWIQAIELRPGNREVVHHALAFYRAKPDMQRTPVLSPNRDQMELPPPPKQGTAAAARGSDAGPPARDLRSRNESAGPSARHRHPARAWRRHRAADALHRQRQGGDGSHARLACSFRKDPSPREVRVTHFMNGTLQSAGRVADTRVDADIAFVSDAMVWGIFPHTHVRGKKWEYVLELPDGTKKNILSVPTLRLQLADVLHVHGAAPGAQGLEARLERLVRQLGCEQVESRTRKSTSSGAIRPGKKCSTRASSSVRLSADVGSRREAVRMPLGARQRGPLASVRGFVGPRRRSSCRARSHQVPRHLDRRHRTHRRGPLRELPLRRRRGAPCRSRPTKRRAPGRARSRKKSSRGGCRRGTRRAATATSATIHRCRRSISRWWSPGRTAAHRAEPRRTSKATPVTSTPLDTDR